MALGYFVMLLSNTSLNQVLSIVFSSLSIVSMVINYVVLLLDVYPPEGSKYLRLPRLFTVFVIILTILHFVFKVSAMQIVSITQVLGPLSCLFVTFNALRRGYVHVSTVIRYLSILFVFFLVVFFLYRFSGLYSSYGGALHAAYYFAFLLPVVFFSKKQFNVICGILFSFLAAFLSYKRGALVAVGGFAAFYVLKLVWERPVKNIFRLLALIIIGALFVLFSIEYLNDDLYYVGDRMSKMIDDEGSGRIYIYSEVSYELSKFQTQDWLLGRGLKATKLINSIDGDTAHNDWLELLYDYGIIAFVLWLLFIIRVFALGFSQIRKRSALGAPILGLMIVYFVTSMISHLFFYGHFYIFCIFLALLFFLYESRYINIS